MPQQSAGLIMYRIEKSEPEFFLIHPGGPFWAKKNEGAWSIPKGIGNTDEEPLATAIREFEEETSIIPNGPYQSLGSAKMKSGKTVYAWAFKGEWNPERGIKSNYINIEWPPRSGKTISIPEADRAEWMSYDKASVMINPGQLPLLQRAYNSLK
ncbi:MAG: NUDIX domain-containing protein [Cyclobacteriaceae bacterium]|nr:NUDIX domain-containing protein [Cyclobacteriaceae bacterium]